MWEALLGSGSDRAERMQDFVADTPLKRFGMPEEVAAIAVTLASDEATYITGTEINIDGGLLAAQRHRLAKHYDCMPLQRKLRSLGKI